MWSLKPFNGAEMRTYLDILNETDDGTRVTVDPVTGNKTVSGAEGTTTYDAKGQKIAYQTPTFNGTSRTTNYQTGEKTTTGQVGGITTSMTQRPDQSTVKTASTNLGDVTATTAQGIGFGGAGKNVQQGGNQVSSVTNAQGQTTSFIGQPQQQDIDKAIQEGPPAGVGPNKTQAVTPAAVSAVQNFKDGVEAGMEMYNLLRQGGVPLSAAIPTAYKYGQAIATGDASQAIAYSANTMADSLNSMLGEFQKMYANLTPGSAYYQKNIAPNPELVATAAQILQDAPTVDELKNSVAVLKSTAQQVTQQPTGNLGRSETSPEMQKIGIEMPQQTVQEDEELPGTKGEWRHGGHSVKYDPSSLTVHVKGKGGEHKHTFGKHPKSDVYRLRVQQIIDKLENNLTETEQLRDLINRLT